MKICLVRSIIAFGGVLLLSSCGSEPEISPRQKAVDHIKKIEAEMKKSMELKPAIADSALAAYDNFIAEFPQDSISPDLLFKGAEIATAIREYTRALTYYKEIDKNYPKYKLYPESLFLQASLLDNYIDRDGEALGAYQKVIDKFPGTTYAQDAASAIKNLGKSDAELIEEFKKKNSQ